MRKNIFAAMFLVAAIILSIGIQSAYAAETQISPQDSALLNNQLETMKADLIRLQIEATSQISAIPITQTVLSQKDLDSLSASLKSLDLAVKGLIQIVQNQNTSPDTKRAVASSLDGIRYSLVSMNSILSAAMPIAQNTDTTNEVAIENNPSTLLIESRKEAIVSSDNNAFLNQDTEEVAASAELSIDNSRTVYSSIGIVLVLIAAGVIFWRMMAGGEEVKPEIQKSENA